MKHAEQGSFSLRYSPAYMVTQTSDRATSLDMVCLDVFGGEIGANPWLALLSATPYRSIAISHHSTLSHQA